MGRFLIGVNCGKSVTQTNRETDFAKKLNKQNDTQAGGQNER